MPAFGAFTGGLNILDEAYAAIDARPSLLAAVHRVRPEPVMKPTTLASLGGTWPKEDGARDTLAVLAAANDTDRDILKAEVARVATNTEWAAKDDLSDLIASNDNDSDLRLASRTDGVIGEGDIDLESLPKERRWTIQTGAYRDAELASTEMNDTKLVVADISPIAVNEISETTSAGRKIYRIRFNGLTETEARNACQAVINKGGDCFTLRNAELGGS